MDKIMINNDRINSLEQSYALEYDEYWIICVHCGYMIECVQISIYEIAMYNLTSNTIIFQLMDINIYFGQ